MLLSLAWLRELTPYEGTAQQLGDSLTMLGIELEEIIHPYENIASIVCAKVISCEAHPESDHLHICKVDAGQEAILDIVCGAPNVAKDQYVAVALPGTKMPDGLVIKASKLRGAPSNGMICSERELGLSEDHSGILVLDRAVTPGTKLVDFLELDQEVLDLSITPNRADCLSMFGFAREVALAYHLPLSFPKFELKETASELKLPELKVEERACLIYAGRVLSNIKIAKSPAKLRYRLQAMGIRSISNIVDVTNFVMLECGQPLHAFDYNCVEGNCIGVDFAKEAEILTTLDGQERKLLTSDITIRDSHRAIGLAGVMGGANSEITDKSCNVFLESAIFTPALIRKTARRLAINSEASYRFERGVDQERCLWALDRAAYLMAEYAEATICPGRCIANAKPYSPSKINFKSQNATKLLGVEITSDFAKKTLTELGCEVQDNSQDNSVIWQVIAPSWRQDLTREADLIEEIGRVYGMDNIPPSLPAISMSNKTTDPDLKLDKDFNFARRLRAWAMSAGLQEAICYSFTGQKELDLLGMAKEERLILLNPLSAEQDTLRTSLAPGLLSALKENLAQGNSSVRLFELAKTFKLAQDNAEYSTACTETRYLALLVYGQRYLEAWPQQAENMDYADIKGLVEHLRYHFNLPELEYQKVEHSFLLPGVKLSFADQCLGYIGRIKPEIADEFHAKLDIWYAEIEVAKLQNLVAKSEVIFKALPSFPPVRRDLTIKANYELSIADILQKIASMNLATLENVILVDYFEPQIKDAEHLDKHLTFRLTFRDKNKTLKDADVDKERERIAAYLVKELDIKL